MELMIVIAIIAILSAIAFPAFRAVQLSAIKTLAKNDANQIAQALQNYRTEYGKYPLEDIEDTAMLESDPEFMKILLSEEEEDMVGPGEYNTRAIVFFEGKDRKSGRGAGFDEEGSFYDPWGNRYEIFLDGNYDNRIQIPGKEKPLRKTVAVRSAGPDGVFAEEEGEKNDDINTWE